MVFQPNPEQMAAVKSVTQHIKAKVTVDYVKCAFTIDFGTDKNTDPTVLKAKHQLMDSLTNQLATQMQQFFGITGSIKELGKPK